VLIIRMVKPPKRRQYRPGQLDSIPTFEVDAKGRFDIDDGSSANPMAPPHNTGRIACIPDFARLERELTANPEKT
ncbi:hypothetical protein PFISCL1PPCAC_224, partial [Pristionchus fissidentatus]